LAFLLTFIAFDEFLEIEGDFDGEHIKINLYDNSQLDKKLKENNLTDEPDLWRIFDTKKDETIGRLLEKKIEYIEYGIDKDEFEVNGTIIIGQKDVFDFITFNCVNLKLTIFESSGLGVSIDPDIVLMFAKTVDRYDTT
jgi:hypothetical protein